MRGRYVRNPAFFQPLYNGSSGFGDYAPAPEFPAQAVSEVKGVLCSDVDVAYGFAAFQADGVAVRASQSIPGREARLIECLRVLLAVFAAFCGYARLIIQ